MKEFVIEAGRPERNVWRDIWLYRELLGFLAWRDILVRYKQTVLGVTWALLQPFLTMAVFTIVFGRIAKLPSDGIPYPVLVLSALLPWQFFSRTLSVSLVDFLISFVLLGAMMAWYGFWPGLRLLALLALVPLAIAAALGPGLLISALNVRFRDFRYIVPFIVQLGVYISPVGFSSSVVPEKWRLLYSLNPLVGVIDAFRWAITGAPVHGSSVLISVVMIAAMLALGIWYFRKTEKTFADII